MRLATNLPLLGCNPSWRATFLPRPFARDASRLSGIHAGLRRSERARPQGGILGKEIRQHVKEEEPYLSPEERQRARAIARRNPLGYKIRKGKKDITEEPGPPRKSRAARLADPRDTLGQGSLLKRFRTGKLLDELREEDEGKQGDRLQHNDFARQMAVAEVQHLMENRQVPPGPRKGRKRPWESAHETKRRVAQSDRLDRFGPGGPGGDARGGRDTFDRSDTRGPRGDAHGGRDTFDRFGPRGPGGDARGGRDTFDRFGPRRPEGDARGGRDTFDRFDTRGPGGDVRGGRDTFDRFGPRGPGGDIRGGRDTFDRFDTRGPKGDAYGGRDTFDRFDTRGPEGDARGGRDTSDRRPHDRGLSHREYDSGRDRHDGGRSREGRTLDGPDVGGIHSELRGGNFAPWNKERGYREILRSPTDGDEKPGAPYRTERTRFEGEGEAMEKKRKPYEPPASIPYTTAASQFMYGASTVEAALLNTRRKLYKLYIYQGGNRRDPGKDEYIRDLAVKRGVKIQYLDQSGLSMLNKMSESRPHNGYVLEASPLPQLPIKALGGVSDEERLPGFKVLVDYQSREEASVNGTNDFIITEPGRYQPFVLLLDQVLDPGNLGAILRTASFMGVTAVAVTKRGTSPITPVVLKASAGAAEALTIFAVDSPVDFARESSRNGWKIYAAVAPTPEAGSRGMDLRSVELADPLLKTPCVLVLGSEGEGLSRQLKRAADFKVSIPNMSGSKIVDSLNVSVATGLLCSAFVRGKTQAATRSVKDAGALF